MPLNKQNVPKQDVIVLHRRTGRWAEFDDPPEYIPRKEDSNIVSHFLATMGGNRNTIGIHREELVDLQEIAHLHGKFIVIKEEDDGGKTED